MGYRIISALALAITASFPALAQPNIVAAIAPNARSVEVNTPATFFVSMVNSGDSEGTNCRVELHPENSAPAILTYQRTDAANQPVGSVDTPFTIGAGASQTLVISVTPQNSYFAALYRFVYACDEASTDSVFGTSDAYIRSFAQGANASDLIMILQTISADGVIRFAENGRRGVAAGAAINNGGPAAYIVIQPVYPGYTFSRSGPITNHYRDLLICQTDNAGICQSTPTSMLELNDVTAGQVITFNIYFDDSADGEVPFMPELLRVTAEATEYQIAGQGTTGMSGATSVAVSEPDGPPLAPDAPLSGVWYGYSGEAGAFGANRIQVTVTPDGRFVLRSFFGKLINTSITPREYIMWGEPQMTRVGDALHLSGNVNSIEPDGSIGTAALDGLVLNLESRMTGASAALGGNRARGYFYRQLPAQQMLPARSDDGQQNTIDDDTWAVARLTPAGFAIAGAWQLNEAQNAFTGNLTAAANDVSDTCTSQVAITPIAPSTGGTATQRFDVSATLDCSGDADLGLSGTYTGWGIADSWIDYLNDERVLCGVVLFLSRGDTSMPLYVYNNVQRPLGSPPCNAFF